MSIDSLPIASQEQINAMNKIAREKYGVTDDPVPTPEVPVEQQAEASEEAPTDISAEAEVSVQESPQENQAQPVPNNKPGTYSKEENLALLRDRARKAEAEREALARQLKAYQEKLDRQSESSPSLAPDDLVEGKHFVQMQQQLNQMQAEARLRSKYPDFDKVVSPSNIASLSEMYPDIAKTIGTSNDLYSQAVTAYTVIKNLGIYAEDYSQDKKIAATNAAKPRPLTSISPQKGDTPLSHANAFANGMTDELAKQLRKEMFDAMKNR